MRQKYFFFKIWNIKIFDVLDFGRKSYFFRTRKKNYGPEKKLGIVPMQKFEIFIYDVFRMILALLSHVLGIIPIEKK